MIVSVLTGWSLSCGVVWWQLTRYRNPRHCRVLTYAGAFAGFLFPVALIFCLPMDIATARYQQCRLTASDPIASCRPSWIVLSPPARDLLRWTWRAAFWTSAAGTWLILPLLQGYVESGHFGVGDKLADSIKFNFLLLLGGAVSIAAGLVLLWTVDGSFLGSAAAFRSFLMAMVNAAGLLFVLVFLGYGLVAVPRAVWRAADRSRILLGLEETAAQSREDMLEADYRLDEVLAEIQRVRSAVPETSDLAPLAEELSKKVLRARDDQPMMILCS